ncbi:MAG: anti-sigma factor antagonist [Nitrospirae bacterium]|nr:MAG: anti-sigma factor antagonist [Nitrospirota bacterium]
MIGSTDTVSKVEAVAQGGHIPMVISEQRVNRDIVIEHFVGRFDINAREDFKGRIDIAVANGYRFVILNLTEVTFIDSAALGWLVLAQRRFYRIGGRLSIVAKQGFVRDILELTDISEWIPIFPHEEAAITALGTQS